MYNLTTDNWQTLFDEYLWIKTNRQKTRTETNIRLLDTTKHIIEKYQGMAEGNNTPRSFVCQTEYPLKRCPN